MDDSTLHRNPGSTPEKFKCCGWQGGLKLSSITMYLNEFPWNLKGNGRKMCLFPKKSLLH